MEIERKFLTAGLPFSLNEFPHTEIEQAYISFQPVIRIRRENGDFTLTIKGKGHMVREEYTLPISAEEYRALSAKAEGYPIRKTRHLIPLPQGLTAEIDVYLEGLTPLITIEVEFPDKKSAHSFHPPEWFGPEVTEDVRYKNNYLSKNGLPKA